MAAKMHYTSFSSEISLDLGWPNFEPENLSIAAHTRFAASYIEAAERALFHQDDVMHPFEFYLGPTIQLTGLAAELTFKTLLRGSGRDEKKIKGFGHSAYEAYCQSISLFDEAKFISIVKNNSELFLPEMVRSRLINHFGEHWPEGWNIFIPQIRLLDEVYDRPFRSRYHKSGDIFLPEVFIVILGIKIINAAMMERIGAKVLPGSILDTSIPENY